MDEVEVRELTTRLAAELLPGVPSWQLRLVYCDDRRGTGWHAEMSPRLRRRGARWRQSRFAVQVGSVSWRGAPACLYSTPRAAVVALRDELKRLRDVVGGILGV